jgi:hypothetical protein
MPQDVYCLPLTVHAGPCSHRERPVTVALPSGALPVAGGSDADRRGRVLRLTEVDGDGRDVGDGLSVPVQFDPAPGDDGGTVTFILSGITPAHATRHYQLAYTMSDDGRETPAHPAQITVADNVLCQEQESLQITTPSATYFYHKHGGGFAGLVDAAGDDWISYRPTGGSDGRYRGIPNLGYPEGHFHPGNTGVVTTIIDQGPLRLTIESASHDGEWRCRWDVYPHVARLTVLKVDHPYWFLYEGTPGGKLDTQTNTIVRSPGEPMPAAERWDVHAPAPAWVIFGDRHSDHVLYLIRHDAGSPRDSYWPMEDNMTVFGFGRLGIQSLMEQVPAHFTIGLAPQGAAYRVEDQINSLLEEPVVVLGEARPVSQHP